LKTQKMDLKSVSYMDKLEEEAFLFSKICRRPMVRWLIGGGLLFFLLYPLIVGFVFQFYLQNQVDSFLKSFSQYAEVKTSWRNLGFWTTMDADVRLKIKTPVNGGSSLSTEASVLPFKLEGRVQHFFGWVTLDFWRPSIGEQRKNPFWKHVQAFDHVTLYIKPTLWKTIYATFEIGHLKTRPSKEFPIIGAVEDGVVKLQWHLNDGFEKVRLAVRHLNLGQELQLRKIEDAGFVFKIDQDDLKTSLSGELFFHGWDDLTQKLGPGLVQLDLKDLHTPGVKKFLQKISKMKEQMSYIQNSPDQMSKLNVLMDLVGLVSEMAKNNPKLELTQFKMKTSQGDIQANGHLGLKDGASGLSLFTIMNQLIFKMQLSAPDQFVSDHLGNYLKSSMIAKKQQELNPQTDMSMGNLAQMMKGSMEANQGASRQEMAKKLAEQKAPTPLDPALEEEIKQLSVKKTKESITMLENKKYLSRDGKKLSTTFEFSNGTFLVNERPIPLAQLMGMIRQ
jgi:hypothetical protein